MGPDGLTIAWTDQASRRRRVRIERRAVGGWDRHVEEFSGGQWRPVGAEIVADIEVEIGVAILNVIEAVGEAGGETVTGPEEADR